MNKTHRIVPCRLLDTTVQQTANSNSQKRSQLDIWVFTSVVNITYIQHHREAFTTKQGQKVDPSHIYLAQAGNQLNATVT